MSIGEEHMNIFERMIRVVKKEKTWTIMKSILLIALLAFVMCSGIWATLTSVITSTMEKDRENVERTHQVALQARMDAKPKIEKLLSEMLHNTGADRVFIMEMHNGTSNTSGLPFLYAEMTYEMTNDSICNVDDDYVKLNMSRFNFAYYFEKKHIWCGPIKDLYDIDPKLAKRMEANDATYLAMVHIHGVDNVLGYIGLTYCNGHQPKNKDEIMAELMSKSQMVSTLLDMNSLMNNSDNEAK